jgi:hypothetical protein
MTMAPSRDVVAFTSPPYAPLNHGASLGEHYSDLRNGHKEGEPAVERHRAGTLNAMADDLRAKLGLELFS